MGVIVSRTAVCAAVLGTAVGVGAVDDIIFGNDHLWFTPFNPIFTIYFAFILGNVLNLVS